MRLCWLCIVATGCGFSSTSASQGHGPADAATDGAPGSDGGGSGSDGGTSAQGCFALWRSGTLKLETPGKLTNQSSGSVDERDPWISSDGRELYYTYQPIGGDDADIYRATRGTPSDPFGTGRVLDNISQGSGESRASFTADGKMIAFASDRATPDTFLLYQATREDRDDDFGAASTDPMAALNAEPGGKYDPFLTANGLELYYDRPAAEWFGADGKPVMKAVPLDPRSLLAG